VALFYCLRRKDEMMTMMKEAEGTGAVEASVSELGELGARAGHVEPPVAAKDASRVIPAKAGIHGHSVSELETLSSWVPASARTTGDGRESDEPSKASEPRPRAANGRFLSSGKGATRVPAKQKRRGKASKKAPPTWSAEKRSLFLAELAATSNVTKSAMAAGMSDAQVYAERRRTPAFREAWTDALSEGYARLEFMMLERANDALLVTGKVTDEKLATNKMHEYSNKLALNLLTAHRALVRESRAGAAPSRHTPNRVAGSKARLIAKLDEMRARSSG
jgi:hypothetical protein